MTTPANTDVESKILTIRSQKVILDADLARLYGVETKNLNKAVSRNKVRFPEDFAFRLTRQEVTSLRFQNGTSNKGRGGTRYAPWTFTEHGAIMASTARTHYIKYNQYPDHWDEIASIFSKDAVLKGSFDKYAESGKRHKPEVDSEFLPPLTTRQLNFGVQRTIDRLIFLRICEDRGIERYSNLLALRSGDNVYWGDF